MARFKVAIKFLVNESGARRSQLRFPYDAWSNIHAYTANRAHVLDDRAIGALAEVQFPGMRHFMAPDVLDSVVQQGLIATRVMEVCVGHV